VNERHVRWILVLVLFLQLVALTAQARESGEQPSRLQAAVLLVVSPIAHLVDSGVGLFEGFTTGLRVRSGLLEENRRLRRELTALKNERILWFDAVGQMERLSQAVEYRRAGAPPLVVADVVYADYTSWLRSLVLYVGDGVERDQAVVAPEGVVGRVVTVAGPYAKVQLLTDRAANVGAMIRRTRRQGIIRGAEEGSLELDFVPLRSDVRIGDQVVTAGIDGIYPRGIPIGTIVAIDEGDELFLRIEVAPSVDFGQLDRAFVLARERLPSSLKQATVDERP
jgi:rod shape-determining protein MreC